MKAPLRSDRSDPQHGFVVVAVLWILVALATLTTIYSVYVANSAVALAVNDDRLKVEAVTSAAIELVAYRLSGPDKNARPSHGTLNFRTGQADVAVSFVSEAARVDLNTAPKDLLAGLFTALGAQPDDANFFADRIVGWRTAPKSSAQNSGAQNEEQSLYRTAGLTYGPRGAPFAHVNELFLVYGVPASLAQRALQFVTVYSGRRDVNVLDAAPEVIAALPGMTPGRLDAFLTQRDASGDMQMLVGTLGDGQPGAGTQASEAFRVIVNARFANGVRTTSEAVIQIGDPYRILAWREDAFGLQPGTSIR